MNLKSVVTSKDRTQFWNRWSNSVSFPKYMQLVVFSINLREKSESFESYFSTRDLFGQYAMTLNLENNILKPINYS